MRRYGASVTWGAPVTRSKAVFLAQLVGLTSAPPLAPQAVGPVPPGATIRVVAPGVAPGVLTGTVVLIDQDTLLLKIPGEGAAVVVPLTEVERLDAYRGRKPDLGATIGAGVAGLVLGAAVGWVAGPTLCRAFDDADDSSCERQGVRSQRIVGAGIVGLVGGVYGARAGARRRHERWQTIAPERVRVGSSARGGLTLSVVFPF